LFIIFRITQKSSNFPLKWRIRASLCFFLSPTFSFIFIS
jgi:hypothetical protein